MRIQNFTSFLFFKARELLDVANAELCKSFNQMVSSYQSTFNPRRTLVTWSIEKEDNQTKESVIKSGMAVVNLNAQPQTWLF